MNLTCSLWPLWFGLMLAGPGLAAAAPLVSQAEAGQINPARVEIVDQDTFQGKKGVALKAGLKAVVEPEGNLADLTFSLNVPNAGPYSLVTHAAADEAGKKLMAAATSKHASLAALLQVGDRRPTSRMVFVPWSQPESCVQNLGVFDLSGGVQNVKVWLPAGVRLDRLEAHAYRPPAVPPEAAAYRPAILPPPAHPRLWVNSNTLARVRANLAHPENQAQWERMQALAAKPFAFKFDPRREVAYNTALENAAVAKAFVYLMSGDAQTGREAVQLMLDYLPRVEFGNLLDITREVGAAIYAAARVYDWCHGLCSPAERDTLRQHLMRLAGGMECGWPPFKGSIVNGHGNEAMVNRDLLAMAIAIHDEDPRPYQYCAWLLLEQLVPMRRFEYQSPRHNQGVSYAAYRFGWEMHAAWLLRGLAGREVFDPNLKSVPKYWLYLRLPNGELLRDGDGVPSGKYWSYAQTALLCYSYSRDPIVKGEYLREGGKGTDPLLHLLLNQPDLQAEPGLDSLPLTLDFGPVLGSMVARTGWDLSTNSDDVVMEIKGGGYHFGNHQHADAGALQLYYRGLQVADLGQYKFYGTPFDFNFNKRSIAHSLLLVVDPQEKFLSTPANDGGSRFLQSHPRSPEQAQQSALFHYGKVVSCSFGPAPARPAFSYFSADLASAYSEKICHYVRRVCFLNLNQRAHPAAILVLDDVRAAQPEFKKYWQINTLNPPQITPGGVSLFNAHHGATGRVDVCMLWPKPEERTLEIKSGPETHNVFGQTFTPPDPAAPEARGSRVLFSPKRAQAQDRFLTLLQVCADPTPPLPYEVAESGAGVTVRIADRVVHLAKDARLISAPFDLKVLADGTEYQVLLAGLQPGSWLVTGSDGTRILQRAAEAGKNTLCFSARGGQYHVAPVNKP